MKEKLLKTNNYHLKLNSKVGRILTQKQLTELTFKNINESKGLLK
ncbi:hypothetical protein [Tenacibaculum insulae]